MGFLTSRKFSAFMIGLIALALTQFFDATQDVAMEIAGVIGADKRGTVSLTA